jgi:hypothetical protein
MLAAPQTASIVPGRFNREIEALNDDALDHIETLWYSGTPRIIFSGWIKLALDSLAGIKASHWVKQFQLYKAQDIALKSGEKVSALRFVMLAVPPECTGDPVDFTREQEREFHMRIRTYQCFLRVDDLGRIVEIVQSPH